MKINLLLFASCREAVGERACSLEIPSGASVGDLRRELPRQLPALAGITGSLSIAVNEEYAPDEHLLGEGDEVALIPPVSGGSQTAFLITEAEIPSDAHAWVSSPGTGAVVRFEGIVRDHNRNVPTEHLEYEAYAPMAQRMLARIGAEVRRRWEVEEIAIWHRVGCLRIGEISVLVSVASAHRSEAFSACRYVIDRIKEVAPIWKKEVGPDGSYWVEGPRAIGAG